MIITPFRGSEQLLNFFAARALLPAGRKPRDGGRDGAFLPRGRKMEKNKNGRGGTRLSDFSVGQLAGSWLYKFAFRGQKLKERKEDRCENFARVAASESRLGG